MTKAWQQIDVFDVYKWSYASDSQLYKSITETKRVFRFFIGLYLDDRILSTESLSNLKAEFVEIKHEESRNKIMMGSSPSLNTEAFVLLTEKTSEVSTLAAMRQSLTNERGRLFCRYYKKNKHLINDCWKLHGKLREEKPPRTNNKSWRAFSKQIFSGNEMTNIAQGLVQQTANSNLPTKSQIEALFQLLNQQTTNQSPPIQASMPRIGQFHKGNSFALGQHNSWIVYS